MAETDELRERVAELEAREAELLRQNKILAARPLRNNLYDRISVSVKTMDIIIAVCVVAILALIGIGVYMANAP